MFGIFKFLDRYDVLSPRTTIHYSREEKKTVRRIVKEINKQIKEKTRVNDDTKGTWFIIEIKIEELLSDKIAKTIVYLISKKRWHGVYFDRYKGIDPHTTFSFINPLYYICEENVY